MEEVSQQLQISFHEGGTHIPPKRLIGLYHSRPYTVSMSEYMSQVSGKSLYFKVSVSGALESLISHL